MAHLAISANAYLIVEVGGLPFQGYLQVISSLSTTGYLCHAGCSPTSINHQLGIDWCMVMAQNDWISQWNKAAKAAKTRYGNAFVWS